jgi:hypothetical protein
MARHIPIQLQATPAVPAEFFRHRVRHMLNLVVESAARAVPLRPVFGNGISPVMIVDHFSKMSVGVLRTSRARSSALNRRHRRERIIN